MSQPEVASFAEFAALARFKRSYITALKASGRLVLTEDGKRVRVAESLQLIEATKDPGKVGVVARHAAARAAQVGEGTATPPIAAPGAIGEAGGVDSGTTEGEGADAHGIRLLSWTPTQLGQTLQIAFGGAERSIDLPLIGAYQAANALLSAGLVIAAGGDPAQTFDALSRLQPVRGRIERAAISRAGAAIYVDYAHTPDALEAAIAALRPHCAGRLIVVFGAGGDRDQGKRPDMGRIAAAQADLGIVTDDNPRSEDPAAIRAMVLAGAAGQLRDGGERRAAICLALAEAGAGDVVLIAGKGHEQGQIVGAGDTMRVLPFDDVTVARECAA